MTREEAREFLLSIANKLGYIGVEDLTDRDGKRMIEALKALEEPQWISVSERLPKLGVRVLISDGEDVEMSQLGERYRDGYVWEFSTCWNDLEDWPYWMPLPEAYKESDTE